MKNSSNVEFIVPATWFSAQSDALPRGWTMSGAGAAPALAGATIGNDFVVYDGTGQSYTFQGNGSGGFTPPEGSTMVLSSSASGWSLDTGDMTYAFDTGGRLVGATSNADNLNVETLTYQWGGSPLRLHQVTDPVTGASVQLQYGVDGTQGGTLKHNPNAPECSSVNGPAYAAPFGMLCGLDWSNGISEDFWYWQGQLYIINEPTGGNVNDTYRLSTLFTNGQPYIFYGIAELDAGLSQTAPVWDDFAIKPLFDGQGRVASLQGPKPSASGIRAGRTYSYVSDSETRVSVDNIAPPSGYMRKVTFDSEGRRVSDADSTGATTTFEWDPRDWLMATTDPAGRRSTVVRDIHGWVTDAYGPGALSCYQTANPLIANGTCPTLPHTQTGYDQNIVGLSGQWWNNTTSFAGKPAVSFTRTGGVNHSWSGVPWPGVNADNTSLRMTGDITFPAAGTYSMRFVQGDGVRLYIDDKIIVDSWATMAGNGFSPSGVFSSPAAGSTHRIRIDHYDESGNAGLIMYWTPPGGAEQIVPADRFSPAYGLVTSTTVNDGSGPPTAPTPSVTTWTEYGTEPALGLVSKVRVDPNGIDLVTEYGYQVAAVGPAIRRLVTRSMPSTAGTWGYAYYQSTTTAISTCPGVSGVAQVGKLMTKTHPGTNPIVEQYAYDASGRQVGYRRNSDPWTCTTYDGRGRPLTTAVPVIAGFAAPARTITSNYAPGGNRLVNTLTDGSGSGPIEAEVDWAGRPVRYRDVWGNVTTTSYDNAGRVWQVTGPAGTKEPVYDASSRLSGFKLDGVAVVGSIGYNSANEMTTVTYSNGTSLDSIGRDAQGRPNAITFKKGTTTLLADTATFSKGGRTMTSTATGGGNTFASTYTYDAVGRLTQAVIDGQTWTYSFANAACATATAGRNSNRTQVTSPAGTYSYCYDNRDRLTSTTDPTATNPVHDSHGNTTSLGGRALTYDQTDRNLTMSFAGSTVTYTRDATNRIITRTHGTSTSRLGYEGSGDSPTFQTTTAGALTERIIALPGGVTLFKQPSAPDAWSYANLHGDNVLTTDHTGTPTFTGIRKYSPDGQPLNGTIKNLTGDGNYGWLGQHQRLAEGPLTGDNLIQMGARPYMPSIGRFLAIDPIEAGSCNDYDYTCGDPINHSDISGLFVFDQSGPNVCLDVSTCVATILRTIGESPEAFLCGVYGCANSSVLSTFGLPACAWYCAVATGATAGLGSLVSIPVCAGSVVGAVPTGGAALAMCAGAISVTGAATSAVFQATSGDPRSNPASGRSIGCAAAGGALSSFAGQIAKSAAVAGAGKVATAAKVGKRAAGPSAKGLCG